MFDIDKHTIATLRSLYTVGSRRHGVSIADSALESLVIDDTSTRVVMMTRHLVD